MGNSDRSVLKLKILVHLILFCHILFLKLFITYTLLKYFKIYGNLSIISFTIDKKINISYKYYRAKLSTSFYEVFSYY